ncbi:SPOR domain-containing protein [Homoserinimonas sp. OAct 916]|uniref:SPOR domain-containing protein n=1 Tax=Homoserinimonas sp. OAct 916 TaxID=2211450 RepID=UPI000DBE24C7|nr:SPOR domain-containing protein [Homoserinimonas sp. OAct 916]
MDTDGIETDEKYWYNLVTGEVEHGRMSPSVDRAGPFATRAEAEHGLEVLRANSRKWAEDDAAEGR